MTFLKNLFGGSKNQTSQQQSGQLSFVSIKQKIYPAIKSTAGTKQAPGERTINITQPDVQPVSKPLVEDLVVYYLVDQGPVFSVLLQKDLPGNISIDELHAIACSNLERDIQVDVQQTTHGPYGLLAGGNYEASMICLTAFWKSFSDHLQSNLVVAIPAKDLVFVVSDNDLVNINKIKGMVTEIFNDGSKLISRNLFKFNRADATWNVYRN